jgi:transposase
MAVADRSGLPLAVGIASGERNEQKLVAETLRARFINALPKKLIGDRAYDSDPLDAQLAKHGIEMIAPNLSTRAIQSQDRRKLRCYKRRWRIERLFAWLMRSRRLVTRYECKAENFLGFVQLACIVILSRRLRDAF